METDKKKWRKQTAKYGNEVILNWLWTTNARTIAINSIQFAFFMLSWFIALLL